LIAGRPPDVFEEGEHPDPESQDEQAEAVIGRFSGHGLPAGQSCRFRPVAVPDRAPVLLVRAAVQLLRLHAPDLIGVDVVPVAAVRAAVVQVDFVAVVVNCFFRDFCCGCCVLFHDWLWLLLLLLLLLFFMIYV
jgi:hypothetical protein